MSISSTSRTVTVALIGNPIGIVLGVLFAAAGAGRLYIARKAP